MSADRELLDLAATAVGITLQWSSVDGVAPRRDDVDSWVSWAPLTDDGDAARLMVDCQIHVDQISYPGRILAGHHPLYPEFQGSYDVSVEVADDAPVGERRAAWRLAVVLAAAAYAEKMP